MKKRSKAPTEPAKVPIPEIGFIAYDKNHDILGFYFKREDFPPETKSFTAVSIHQGGN